MRYIYQHKDWPKFRWDSAELAAELEAASFSTGKFSGRLAAIGFEMQSDAVCETLSAEILNSAEIEGERLNRDDVRSSVAKRMEIVLSGAKSATSREAEARADMIIDATRNWEAPMTKENNYDKETSKRYCGDCVCRAAKAYGHDHRLFRNSVACHFPGRRSAA
jgi:Fic family protein